MVRSVPWVLIQTTSQKLRDEPNPCGDQGPEPLTTESGTARAREGSRPPPTIPITAKLRVPLLFQTIRAQGKRLSFCSQAIPFPSIHGPLRIRAIGEQQTRCPSHHSPCWNWARTRIYPLISARRWRASVQLTSAPFPSRISCQPTKPKPMLANTVIVSR